MLYRFTQAAENKLQVAGQEVSGGETVELDPAVAGQFPGGVLVPVEEESASVPDEPETVPDDKPVAPGPDVDETQSSVSKGSRG